METTVNTRILEVKKHLKLTDIEFCNRTGFSTGTLHRIKKGVETSSKTLATVADTFGVDREWLFHGIGEMKIESVERIGSTESWKDEAYATVKSQVSHLQQEVEWLRALVSKITGTPDFLKGIDSAGADDPINVVRVAA